MNLKRIVRSAIKCLAAMGNILSAFFVGVLGALISLAVLGTHMIVSMGVLDLLGWWGFGVHAAVVVALILGFVRIRDVREVGWWVSMGIIPAAWPICLVVGAVASLSLVTQKGWSSLCTWCEYES